MKNTNIIMILVILLAVGIFIKFAPQSIISENTYVSGQVQQYFDRCGTTANPCIYKIVTTLETKPYKLVIFGAAPTYTTQTGTETACLSLDQYSSQWSASGGSRSNFCQRLGYVDCGTRIGYGCQACGTNSQYCSRYTYTTATRIWCEIDKAKVYDTLINPSQTSDLSLYINANLNKDDAVTEVKCYSDLPAGRLELSNTPITAEYAPVITPPAEQQPTAPVNTETDTETGIADSISNTINTYTPPSVKGIWDRFKEWILAILVFIPFLPP